MARARRRWAAQVAGEVSALRIVSWQLKPLVYRRLFRRRLRDCATFSSPAPFMTPSVMRTRPGSWIGWRCFRSERRIKRLPGGDRHAHREVRQGPILRRTGRRRDRDACVSPGGTWHDRIRSGQAAGESHAWRRDSSRRAKDQQGQRADARRLLQSQATHYFFRREVESSRRESKSSTAKQIGIAENGG